eukprot:CAMPEP_0114557526 /NCGR_PEP_ID=MMETSP0114-20121206/9877_1 /TAXON_ID=31324 /ORGANISM="Goniomonas sp, Strain m" /LENGTH=499 /DNA_ID=CAMNT_0001742819 /DNA_START=44 /DNA_END=1543 /DNA_ORIENTATION=+
MSLTVFAELVSESSGPKPTRRKLNRRAWTPDEQEKLKELVDKFGKRWSLVAKKLPNRTLDQCREHWRTHLDPRLEHLQAVGDEPKPRRFRVSVQSSNADKDSKQQCRDGAGQSAHVSRGEKPAAKLRLLVQPSTPMARPVLPSVRMSESALSAPGRVSSSNPHYPPQNNYCPIFIPPKEFEQARAQFPLPDNVLPRLSEMHSPGSISLTSSGNLNTGHHGLHQDRHSHQYHPMDHTHTSGYPTGGNPHVQPPSKSGPSVNVRSSSSWSGPGLPSGAGFGGGWQPDNLQPSAESDWHSGHYTPRCHPGLPQLQDQRYFEVDDRRDLQAAQQSHVADLGGHSTPRVSGHGGSGSQGWGYESQNPISSHPQSVLHTGYLQQRMTDSNLPGPFALPGPGQLDGRYTHRSELPQPGPSPTWSDYRDSGLKQGQPGKSQAWGGSLQHGGGGPPGGSQVMDRSWQGISQPGQWGGSRNPKLGDSFARPTTPSTVAPRDPPSWGREF